MKIPYIRPIPAGISYAAGFSDICRDYRSLKYLLTTLLFWAILVSADSLPESLMVPDFPTFAGITGHLSTYWPPCYFGPFWSVRTLFSLLKAITA